MQELQAQSDAFNKVLISIQLIDSSQQHSQMPGCGAQQEQFCVVLADPLKQVTQAAQGGSTAHPPKLDRFVIC